MEYIPQAVKDSIPDRKTFGALGTGIAGYSVAGASGAFVSTSVAFPDRTKRYLELLVSFVFDTLRWIIRQPAGSLVVLRLANVLADTLCNWVAERGHETLEILRDRQSKVLIDKGDAVLVWSDGGEWQIARVAGVPESRRLIPGVPGLQTNAGMYQLEKVKDGDREKVNAKDAKGRATWAKADDANASYAFLERDMPSVDRAEIWTLHELQKYRLNKGADIAVKEEILLQPIVEMGLATALHKANPMREMVDWLSENLRAVTAAATGGSNLQWIGDMLIQGGTEFLDYQTLAVRQRWGTHILDLHVLLGNEHFRLLKRMWTDTIRPCYYRFMTQNQAVTQCRALSTRARCNAATFVRHALTRIIRVRVPAGANSRAPPDFHVLQGSWVQQSGGAVGMAPMGVVVHTVLHGFGLREKEGVLASLFRWAYDGSEVSYDSSWDVEVVTGPVFVPSGNYWEVPLVVKSISAVPQVWQKGVDLQISHFTGASPAGTPTYDEYAAGEVAPRTTYTVDDVGAATFETIKVPCTWVDGDAITLKPKGCNATTSATLAEPLREAASTMYKEFVDPVLWGAKVQLDENLLPESGASRVAAVGAAATVPVVIFKAAGLISGVVQIPVRSMVSAGAQDWLKSRLQSVRQRKNLSVTSDLAQRLLRKKVESFRAVRGDFGVLARKFKRETGYSGVPLCSGIDVTKDGRYGWFVPLRIPIEIRIRTQGTSTSVFASTSFTCDRVYVVQNRGRIELYPSTPMRIPRRRSIAPFGPISRSCASSCLRTSRPVCRTSSSGSAVHPRSNSTRLSAPLWATCVRPSSSCHSRTRTSWTPGRGRRGGRSAAGAASEAAGAAGAAGADAGFGRRRADEYGEQLLDILADAERD